MKAGERLTLDSTLTPPQDIRHGMFQLHLVGKVNNRDIAVSKHFGIGSLLVLKRAHHTLKMDGDLADWRELGIPNGIAESRKQVVYGVDNWQGADDLSARVWLRWTEHRELYLAIEVTDDTLVTGGEDPLKSDGIQVMVDVRSEWKHFMNECTGGAFNLTLMPGDENTPATATYGRLRFGSIRGVASRKTEKGYIMELDIHFHTAQVDDPGWVVKRPLRVGLLVHDSDDPEARTRQSTIGAWRTAEDAAENCDSLTTFVTE